jgi:hypothetical protein
VYWRNRCPSIKHRSRWTLGVWTVTKYCKRLHKPFFFLYTVNRFIYLFIYFKWTAVALYDQWRVEFRSKIKLLAVILYIQILYYILLYYIELRESQTATFTFSSVLQFTPDCTALSLTVERWLAVTNSRERARLCKAKVWCDKSKLVAGFLSRKIRPIHVSAFTLYGILSPRRVWCERTVEASTGTVNLHVTWRSLMPGVQLPNIYRVHLLAP